MVDRKFYAKNKEPLEIGEASRNSAVREFTAVNGCESGSEPVWRELELRTGLRVSSFEAMVIPPKINCSEK